jgi:hypothetical protein
MLAVQKADHPGDLNKPWGLKQGDSNKSRGFKQQI